MSAQKLRLPLDSPRATVRSVGGKGASLAVLARAGLPVPAGFHLTTSAYRRFVSTTGLDHRIQAVLARTDPGDTPALADAARQIAELFHTHELPEDIADAIADGYAELGNGDIAVAVRSSASAEDLPSASFAGQMESYLNIRGTGEVAAAVKNCWASLWTNRAIRYRERHDIDSAEVGLAVVVQELVDAEAAGVMFTADPVTGDRDRLVINAAWGLGEALASGAVTGDTITVDTATAAVVDRRTGDKAVMTTRAGEGTTREPVPADRRRTPVLTDSQALVLAGIGASVSTLYRKPMDIEWVMRDDGFAIVQARPITGLASAQAPREVWNDSRNGDFLWTSSNLGEAVPSVMTPLTWSMLLNTMSAAMAVPEVGDMRLAGNIGGRFYLNLTLMHGTAAAIGIGKLMRQATSMAFGAVPPEIGQPEIPMSRGKLIGRALPGYLRYQRDVRACQKNLGARVAEFPVQCDAARAAIAEAEDIRALFEIWRVHCEPLHRDGPRLVAAGSRVNGLALARLYPWLRRYVDNADANVLTGSAHILGPSPASLGPLTGLRQLAAGEIDRAAYARRWGHRGPDELEISVPRPGEDPDWIDRQLAGLRDAPSVDALLAKQTSAHAAAVRRFAARYPHKVKALRRRLRLAAEAIRAREDTRSEATRSVWVVRDWVVRAGELSGHGDDLFYLGIEELLAVLGSDETALARIPARRAAYAHYRGLPPYPVLIRGRFDPEAWARDPNRRQDVFDADTAEPMSDRVCGTAGSAGVVEGIARVIADPVHSDRLGVGEILVTRATNVGWTPIFPRAAAVVTDIGAPLSHAAIVARELGIPAVVGCGNATSRLRDGDRVRVDGGTGTVEVLDE